MNNHYYLEPTYLAKGIPGVYGLRNKITTYIYVGKAIDIGVKPSQHFPKLRRNKHHTPLLQQDYNTYGEKSFELIILNDCSMKMHEMSLEDLHAYLFDRELEEFKIHKKLYNVAITGRFGIGFVDASSKKRRSVAGKKSMEDYLAPEKLDPELREKNRQERSKRAAECQTRPDVVARKSASNRKAGAKGWETRKAREAADPNLTLQRRARCKEARRIGMLDPVERENRRKASVQGHITRKQKLEKKNAPI